MLKQKIMPDFGKYIWSIFSYTWGKFSALKRFDQKMACNGEKIAIPRITRRKNVKKHLNQLLFNASTLENFKVTKLPLRLGHPVTTKMRYCTRKSDGRLHVCANELNYAVKSYFLQFFNISPKKSQKHKFFPIAILSGFLDFHPMKQFVNSWYWPEILKILHSFLFNFKNRFGSSKNKKMYN